jgi:hypothetical protein
VPANHVVVVDRWRPPRVLAMGMDGKITAPQSERAL